MTYHLKKLICQMIKNIILSISITNNKEIYKNMQNMESTLIALQNAKSEIRGTTLITYIVPGSTDLWLANKHLSNEIATASNIKSKQVKSAVTDALKSLLGTFESYCDKNKTPPNGLVMLAGVLSSSENKKDSKPNATQIECYI